MSSPETPEVPAPSQASAIRVFLVEDSPALLKSLLKSLSAHPSDVDVVGTALDGERALETLEESIPEVMLLDLELPGIDGIEVTRRLKARHPEVDVLILTSFDDEEKVYEAMQAGASGYLVKRVSIERILDAIREVRQGGTVLEPIIARRFWTYFQSVQANPRERIDPFGLTKTEREILTFIGKGLSNAEVGEVMNIERRRIRSHLACVYRKMGVNTHVEAVLKALRAGLIEL